MVCKQALKFQNRQSYDPLTNRIRSDKVIFITDETPLSPSVYFCPVLF